MPKPRLHLTARAILVRQDAVLVLRGRGRDSTGLPGGHIKPGEQAIAALIRELREELGAELGYVAWLATIDHTWVGPAGQEHELMELYAVHTWPLTAPLRAVEPHLTSLWVQWWLLGSVDLRPRQVWPWIAQVARRVA